MVFLLKLLFAVGALVGLFVASITGGTAGALGFLLLAALLICGFVMVENLFLMLRDSFFR